MAVQVQELKTNDKRYSRSPFIEYLGATFGDTKTGEPFSGGRYSPDGGTVFHFNAQGQLHNDMDADGNPLPAITMEAALHGEWWENGRLHSGEKDGSLLPAVISDNGQWEEFWHHGELIMVRSYGNIKIEQVERL